jgi:hypothetical protein
VQLVAAEMLMTEKTHLNPEELGLVAAKMLVLVLRSCTW